MSKNKKQATPSLKLQIDSEVTRGIRQHARAFMTTEVCGVLVGEERNGAVEVQASIEASQAAQAGTHVTFTQDAWEEIYRVKDQDYPDHRIVGWYHSHPGFGVFLSEHDTFIHRNFFSSPNQVAWVYDPHTDEEGCFGWIDGEIHRIPLLAIVDQSGDGEERTPREDVHASANETPQAEEISVSHSRRPPPPRKRQTKSPAQMAINTASYLGVAIIGFLTCFYLFPSFVGLAVDPATMTPLLINGKPVIVQGPQFLQFIDGIQLSPRPGPELPAGEPSTAGAHQTAAPTRSSAPPQTGTTPAKPQPNSKAEGSK